MILESINCLYGLFQSVLRSEEIVGENPRLEVENNYKPVSVLFESTRDETRQTNLLPHVRTLTTRNHEELASFVKEVGFKKIDVLPLQTREIAIVMDINKVIYWRTQPHFKSMMVNGKDTEIVIFPKTQVEFLTSDGLPNNIGKVQGMKEMVYMSTMTGNLPIEVLSKGLRYTTQRDFNTLVVPKGNFYDEKYLKLDGIRISGNKGIFNVVCYLRTNIGITTIGVTPRTPLNEEIVTPRTLTINLPYTLWVEEQGLRLPTIMTRITAENYTK